MLFRSANLALVICLFSSLAHADIWGHRVPGNPEIKFAAPTYQESCKISARGSELTIKYYGDYAHCYYKYVCNNGSNMCGHRLRINRYTCNNSNFEVDIKTGKCKERELCPDGYQLGQGGQCFENRPTPKESGVAECTAPSTTTTPAEGNPIYISNGLKLQIENDFSGPFNLTRIYNSNLGYWSFSYRQRLILVNENTLLLEHSDGKTFRFTQNDLGQWQSDNDVFAKLTAINENNARWQVVYSGNRTEQFDEQGRLILIKTLSGLVWTLSHTDTTTTIENPFKNKLVYTINNGLIEKAVINDDKTLQYQYDDQKRLIKVTLVDGSTRQYHYENSSFPYHLTGITNEQGVRYATWDYDAQGRGILSEHTDGAEKVTFEYHDDNSTTVTNPLGKKTTYYFSKIEGINRVTKVEGHASANCAAANREYTYYDNGLLQSKTDWKGVTTSYEYNDRGLLTRKVAASGTTNQQEMLTEWHETFRLPTQVTEANRTVHYTYDDQGRLTQQTVTTDPNYSGNTGNNSGGTSGNTNENGSNSSSNNGNGSTTEQPSSKDSDNDGLSDAYETLYGLNPHKNDASDDSDNDGLTNLEEFEQGLNPTVADSLSSTLHQAIQALSPIRHFVADDIKGATVQDRSKHASATILAVSDRAKIEDNISHNNNPLISSKSFDLNGTHYLAMGAMEAEDIDNGFTWMGWLTLDTRQPWQRIFSLSNGPKNNVINLSFKENTSRLGIFLFNGSNMEFFQPENTYLTVGQSFFVAMKYKEGLYQVFINGELISSIQGVQPTSVKRSFFNVGHSQWNKNTGFGVDGFDGFGVSDFKFQRIAIFNKALSNQQISTLSSLSTLKHDSDYDQDGMPDQFELSYGLNAYQNDANEDPDNDGLSNLDEFKQGLNPTVADSTSLELNKNIIALSPIRHFVADDISGSSMPDRSGHKDASLMSVTGQEASTSSLAASDTPQIASKSFDLNGSHYLAMGSMEAKTVDNGFTWMGWFTLDSIQTWQRIFNMGNGRQDNIFNVTFRENSTDILIGLINGSTNVLGHHTASNIKAGEHFFIAITHQEGLYQVFINGKLLYSKQGAAPSSIDRNFFNVGYSQWNKHLGRGSDGVNGLGVSDFKFQRIAIFDKALSEAQINSLNTF